MGKIISNTRMNIERIKEGKNTLKVLIMSHTISAPTLHEGEVKV